MSLHQWERDREEEWTAINNRIVILREELAELEKELSENEDETYEDYVADYSFDELKGGSEDE